MSTGRIVLVVSIALYAACLFLDTFSVTWRPSFAPGWWLLLFGGLQLLLNHPTECLPWIANPLLSLAWILVLMRYRLAAAGFAVGALVLGVEFLGVASVDTKDGPVEVTGYKEGYWLWLASMAVAFAAALLSAKQSGPIKAEA